MYSFQSQIYIFDIYSAILFFSRNSYLSQIGTNTAAFECSQWNGDRLRNDTAPSVTGHSYLGRLCYE